MVLRLLWFGTIAREGYLLGQGELLARRKRGAVTQTVCERVPMIGPGVMRVGLGGGWSRHGRTRLG